MPKKYNPSQKVDTGRASVIGATIAEESTIVGSTVAKVTAAKALFQSLKPGDLIEIGLQGETKWHAIRVTIVASFPSYFVYSKGRYNETLSLGMYLERDMQIRKLEEGEDMPMPRGSISTKPTKERLEQAIQESNSVNKLLRKFSVGTKKLYEWINEYGLSLDNLKPAKKDGKKVEPAKEVMELLETKAKPEPEPEPEEKEPTANIQALGNLDNLSGPELFDLGKKVLDRIIDNVAAARVERLREEQKEQPAARLYPVTVYAGKNTHREQLRHLQSELSEVTEVLFELTGQREDKERIAQYLLVELHDVCQSAYTMMDIVTDIWGGDIEEARQEMIRKNQERGYYELGGDANEEGQVRNACQETA